MDLEKSASGAKGSLDEKALASALNRGHVRIARRMMETYEGEHADMISKGLCNFVSCQALKQLSHTNPARVAYLIKYFSDRRWDLWVDGGIIYLNGYSDKLKNNKKQ